MCHIFYTTAQNNKQPMQTIWVDALLRVTKVCTKCSSPICHSLNLMSQNGGGLYVPRYPHTIPSHKTRGATCDDPKILVRNISAYNFHTCVSSAFILYFFEEFYSRLYGNRVAAHFPSLNHHISPLHIRAEIVEEMESIFRFYDHQGSL